MSRYSELVIAQGASNYWTLDETAAPYTDSVGGVHLTYSESITSELAAVRSGIAVVTAGFTRSESENSITFNAAFGFSYSFLVKFTNFNVNRGVIGKRQNTTTSRTFSAFVFNLATGSGLSLDIGNSGSRWTTGYYPPTGEWVHIAYTYDPTTTNGAATMLVGGLQASVDGSAGSLMSGTIDEVSLFTRKTLSAAEVRDQYATVFPITRVFDGTNWHHADKHVIS